MEHIADFGLAFAVVIWDRLVEAEEKISQSQKKRSPRAPERNRIGILCPYVHDSRSFDIWARHSRLARRFRNRRSSAGYKRT